MMTKNQLLEKSPKQNKFNFGLFLRGYLNVLVNGVVMLFVIGLPLYFILVSWIGLNFWIFFVIYLFCAYLVSPYMSRFRFGDYLLGYFEKWEKNMKKNLK